MHPDLFQAVQTLSLTDYERLPRFAFREEPIDAWLGGGRWGCLAGRSALTVVLDAWT